MEIKEANDENSSTGSCSSSDPKAQVDTPSGINENQASTSKIIGYDKYHPASEIVVTGNTDIKSRDWANVLTNADSIAKGFERAKFTYTNRNADHKADKQDNNNEDSNELTTAVPQAFKDDDGSVAAFNGNKSDGNNSGGASSEGTENTALLATASNNNDSNDSSSSAGSSEVGTPVLTAHTCSPPPSGPAVRYSVFDPRHPKF
jgi:hypothetical protein